MDNATAYPSVDSSSGEHLAANVEVTLDKDGWSVVTLDCLHEVENLLDALEVNQVSERDVQVLGNSSFCVRWK